MAIINMQWPNVLLDDRLFWCRNNSGQFTVRNCFAINFHSSGAASNLWNAIWKSPLQERKKLFLWRDLVDTMPTEEKLSQKIVGIEDLCLVCGECLESSFHMFKTCLGIQALAFPNNWGGKIDD